MENRRSVRRHVANPDDPPVKRPPIGSRGLMPGPYYLGLRGRLTIIQGQLYLVVLFVALQLFLIAQALLELLSGHTDQLIWLTVVSGICFIITLVVWLWPNRRITQS